MLFGKESSETVLPTPNKPWDAVGRLWAAVARLTRCVAHGAPIYCGSEQPCGFIYFTIIRSCRNQFFGRPWRPVEARGGPWKPVEARGSPWRPVEVRGGPWKLVAPALPMPLPCPCPCLGHMGFLVPAARNLAELAVEPTGREGMVVSQDLPFPRAL